MLRVIPRGNIDAIHDKEIVFFIAIPYHLFLCCNEIVYHLFAIYKTQLNGNFKIIKSKFLGFLVS